LSLLLEQTHLPLVGPGRPARPRPLKRTLAAAVCVAAALSVSGLLAWGGLAWFDGIAGGVLIAAALAIAGAAAAGLVILYRWMGSAEAERRRLDLLVGASQALPGAMFVVAPEGALAYANSAYRQFVAGGLDLAAPVPALRAQLLQDDDESIERFERLEQNAGQGVSAQAELRMRNGAGETVWRDVAVHPLPDLPGHALWLIDDVTARRQIEDIIREEQEKVVDFLEHAPIGFYSVDGEGRFLLVNQTLATWLETTPEELVAGDVRLHDVIADNIPADLPPHDPFGEGGQDIGEATFRGRRGRLFQVHISQSVVHEPGGPGDGVRTRSVVRDLTPQREWEKALERSEHRFQSFFEQAPVGIAVVDREGELKEYNPAFRAMIGAKTPAAGQVDPLLGRPVAEIFDPGDRREMMTRMADAVRAQVAVVAPVDVRIAGQEGFVAALFISRMDDPAGGVSGLMLHFIDVTEQRNLALQFVQSQKMQAVGQLAGGVAHDFNNLLTAMIGFCDLMLLRHRPGEQSFADIMQIKQNANRAANLVRQLLAFSRQQTLQPRVINVTDVLSELSNLLRRLIGVGVELEIVHDRDLGLVKVDENQLEQVIINLVVNARDAMTDGGTVSIRTANETLTTAIRRGDDTMEPGDYVVIAVADTGHGIPAKIIDRIFDPFFTTKEVGAGTGLGLSTAYGILHQHGGFIAVESATASNRHGTTFRVYLPRYAGAAEAAGAEADTAAASDLTGAGTVLLVEDEDPVRLFSARALRSKGYRVLEARTGEAALELLEHQGDAIDLLITDVVMPRMDGPTLVARAREKLPEMRVMCMSGYAEEALSERIKQAGGIHFLSKPFTLKQLATKVKEVMASPPRT
jgi:two-component system cell cycle sensor histidine kinase/response regulator CckA